MLCTAISCSNSKVESEVSSVAANVATTVSEKLNKPIAESQQSKTEDIKESTDITPDAQEKTKEAPEKEEEPKVKEKSEAYKKASAERKRKRREAREAKRKKEREAKTEKAKLKDELVDKGVDIKLEASDSGSPKMTFKETEFNFGVIKQGDKINHEFVFENTGSGDLEIVNVHVTCGCTTPSYPFLPIAPGDKGTIGVSYNSTGKLGNQKPMITVVTNAKPHTYKIYMKGVVDAERATGEKIEKDTSIEKN